MHKLRLATLKFSTDPALPPYNGARAIEIVVGDPHGTLTAYVSETMNPPLLGKFTQMDLATGPVDREQLKKFAQDILEALG